MKEVNDEYCIPVSGDPLVPMGRWDHCSCGRKGITMHGASWNYRQHVASRGKLHGGACNFDSFAMHRSN